MRGTPQQVALVLRRKAAALERAVRQAEADSLKEALAYARSLSTGGLTSQQLRSLGHPYRVGGSSARLPQSAALVNLQRGEFYLGWKTTGPRLTKGGLQSKLTNESDVAKFILKGTRRMVARPFGPVIRARIAAGRARRHRQALKAIHSGG